MSSSFSPCKSCWFGGWGRGGWSRRGQKREGNKTIRRGETTRRGEGRTGSQRSRGIKKTETQNCFNEWRRRHTQLNYQKVCVIQVVYRFCLKCCLTHRSPKVSRTKSPPYVPQPTTSSQPQSHTHSTHAHTDIPPAQSHTKPRPTASKQVPKKAEKKTTIAL